MRARLLIALLAAALLPTASAEAETAGDLRAEIGTLTEQVAGQWANLVTPTAVFRNPLDRKSVV